MTSIAIIDYGAGNLRSVEKAFAFIGAPAFVTGDPAEISSADALVLPGVGAFEAGMKKLGGLKDIIADRAMNSDVPLLGICLGMQMLYEESSEGGVHKGLGIVPGSIARFDGVEKVPHMGWNSISIKRQHPLLKGVEDGSFVYFVHSYRAGVSGDTVASSDYGGNFTAVVARGKIVGTQFHPEKSGDTGLQMLRNFADSI
jgi:imidazole glycerol-phosphate synthase subunit HisH